MSSSGGGIVGGLGGGSGIGSLLGGVGGLIGNLTIDGGMDSYEDALATLQGWQQPDFNWQKVTPAQLQVVAKFIPQAYEAVVPSQVKQAADSPELRQSQMQGIQRYEQMAQEGLPLQDRLDAQEAQGSMRQAYRQAAGGQLRDLQRRGMAGGGAEAAMSSGMQQGAANLARGQGADLARQAVQNKLTGIQGAIGASNALRSQDYGIRQGQADSYNNFSKWLSELQTGTRANNANAANQANAWNANNQQQTSNWNTQNRQNTTERGIDRENSLKQWGGEMDFRKRQAVAGQQNLIGGAQDAEKAGYIDNITGIGQGIGGAIPGLSSFF